VRKNVKERGVKLEERFARENIKKKVLVVASENVKNTTRIRNRALYSSFENSIQWGGNYLRKYSIQITTTLAPRYVHTPFR
jgi:hypothetical protein